MMLDPVLHNIQQAKQSAQFFAQLMQLNPELMLPAALPLIAARLMGADGFEEEDEDAPEPEFAVI
ncbi:MAG: hypothetical protein ABI647_18450 [Gemmatimonadota bacterium]